MAGGYGRGFSLSSHMRSCRFSVEGIRRRRKSGDFDVRHIVLCDDLVQIEGGGTRDGMLSHQHVQRFCVIWYVRLVRGDEKLKYLTVCGRSGIPVIPRPLFAFFMPIAPASRPACGWAIRQGRHLYAVTLYSFQQCRVMLSLISSYLRIARMFTTSFECSDSREQLEEIWYLYTAVLRLHLEDRSRK